MEMRFKNQSRNEIEAKKIQLLNEEQKPFPMEDASNRIFSKDSQNPRHADQGNTEQRGMRYRDHSRGRSEEQGGARHGGREREKRRGEVKRRAPWRLESRF